MPRSALLALLGAAVLSAGLEAQIVDETLVPRGRFRLQAATSFTSWDSRYGARAGEAGTVEEELASDLTDPTGAKIFPGLESLQESLRALTGQSQLAAILGSTVAHVAHDVTRIDFGAHVGVFDWLTVGVVVPWVRARTVVDVAHRPDTVAGHLGLNPMSSSSEAVNTFLGKLDEAALLSGLVAEGACTNAPGSPECTSAQALATRAASFRDRARAAYTASPFFPLQGTATAARLSEVTAALDADLQAAGLLPIGTSMVYASRRLEARDFAGFPANARSGIQSSELGDIAGIWQVGDVEVSALVKLLEGALRDSVGAPAKVRYRLLVGGTVRLATGKVDEHDVLLDIGSGDGQRDFEGRAIGALQAGRLGLRAGVRYGVQQPVRLLRRVAAPERVLAPVGTLRAVEWSPGSYVGIEAAPEWRLSDELSITGEYRMYRKAEDGYEVLGDDQPGQTPVDGVELERESGVTLHQAGLGLAYSTVFAWREGRTTAPMELRARFLAPVSGSGGQTPVATRVEFSVRIFRGIWGGDPAPAGTAPGGS